MSRRGRLSMVPMSRARCGQREDVGHTARSISRQAKSCSQQSETTSIDEPRKAQPTYFKPAVISLDVSNPKTLVPALFSRAIPRLQLVPAEPGQSCTAKTLIGYGVHVRTLPLLDKHTEQPPVPRRPAVPWSHHHALLSFLPPTLSPLQGLRWVPPPRSPDDAAVPLEQRRCRHTLSAIDMAICSPQPPVVAQAAAAAG